MINQIHPTEQAASSDPSHHDAHSKPEQSSLPPELLVEPIPPNYSDLITQEELRYFLSSVEASRQCAELRGRLVARLEGGAQVEPGDLEPFMTTDLQLTCSWKGLERAIGQGEVSRIKRLVEKTEYRRLRIRDSAGNIRGWGENRRPGHSGP